MSAILLAVDGPQSGEWFDALHGHRGPHELRLWPGAVGNPDDISYACVWNPPRGLLVQFRNLKAIVNLGAGVDRLLSDPGLPVVPISRAAHDDLTQRVTGYVVLHVLMHHRRQRLYDAQQRERLWREHDQPAAGDVAVGVMGLGVIGANAADALARLGFDVAGWSRSPKDLSGIATFHGASGLDAFLARTEILVCLLPLTGDTKGLLNRSLFRKLKHNGAAGGGVLINTGRGALQVDADIVAALEEGFLAGATLDVFPQEPLPADSPLWSHPMVTVTPHTAGDISPRVFAPDVMAQIERVERGLPMQNAVERARGY